MRMATKYSGVVKDGKFIPDDKNYFYEYYRREGKRINVIIQSERKTRSNDQNRYLWGVVYDFISAETGHDNEEIHEIMRHQFLMTHTDIGDYPKSTTKLSTVEFMEYIEKIRVWAGEYLGIRIPLPHEVDYEF